MKTTNKLIVSGLLLAGLMNGAQAENSNQICVQAAAGALYLGGSSMNAFQNCKQGSSSADPHITTFGGVAYDHNFPGDYTLLDMQDGSGFSLVGRFVADKGDKAGAYTIAKAVKLQWPEHSVEIHRADQTVIVVDGKVTQLKNKNTIKIGDVGYILRKDKTYFIANTVSDIATVVYANSFYLDIQVTVPSQIDSRGLLGDPKAMQLLDRNGVELSVSADGSDPELGKVSRADFVNFVDSWRIADANVFTSSNLPQTPNYNAKIYTLSDLGSKKMKKAKLQCDIFAQVFPDSFNNYNCLYDLGFGGMKFVSSVRHYQAYSQRMEVAN
ncbi:MAG: VWD domain-containing protein [Methylococcales bacterium]|nr:VWD domain-containing protein [Methylococcales bacterium]